MSMVAMNIMQAIMIMGLYTLTMVIVPAKLLKKKVGSRPFSERFMIYVTAGNFYVINLVYFLQLLHICNWFTMLLFSVLLYFLVRFHKRWKLLKEKLVGIFTCIHRIITGTQGIKSFLARIFAGIKKIFLQKVDLAYNAVLENKLETLLTIIVMVVVCVTYGYNSIVRYGYTASDIPVHNYWINGLTDNQIFINGVYPFGYHNVLYFMHEIFRIDVYVLLRLFAMTQTLYMHLMLLAFVRSVVKSIYFAYAGIFIYAGTALLQTNCIARFMSVLPQEYGMIFIFPSIYFIFSYYRNRKETGSREYIIDLTVAAAAFSLAFTVHFYGTIATGLCCIAIMIGFITVFFRKKYLIPLMTALLASIVVAILPLGAAYAMGTPLQGSIGWGMSVISSGNQSQGTASDKDEDSDGKSDTSAYSRLPEDEEYWALTPEEIAKISSGEWYYDFENSVVVRESPVTEDIEKDESNSEAEEAVDEHSGFKAVFERIRRYCIKVYNDFCENMGDMVVQSHVHAYVNIMLISIAGSVILGIIFHILKQPHYGSVLISMALSTLLLHQLFLCYDFKIPQLMDQNRCRIYMTYVYMAQIMISFDAVVYFCMKYTGLIRFIRKTGFVMALALSIFVLSVYGRRIPLEISAENIFETNGAMYCLGSILESHNNLEWTIVSPNDELQMIKDMGYHYETIDLLKDINNYSEYKQVTIPTRYVYFYIEKRPLNYSVVYDKSGQMISYEGAKRQLPYATGINAYMGENRWIVMSKMYYWAEAFRKLFPQDMTVYYEDEEFICYRLVQNTSHLHNLMIDFGIN